MSRPNWPQIAGWAMAGLAAVLLWTGGAARAVLALILISGAGWIFARS